jgi:hypothetical protein
MKASAPARRTRRRWSAPRARRARRRRGRWPTGDGPRPRGSQLASQRSVTRRPGPWSAGPRPGRRSAPARSRPAGPAGPRPAPAARRPQRPRGPGSPPRPAPPTDSGEDAAGARPQKRGGIARSTAALTRAARTSHGGSAYTGRQRSTASARRKTAGQAGPRQVPGEALSLCGRRARWRARPRRTTLRSMKGRPRGSRVASAAAASWPSPRAGRGPRPRGPAFPGGVPPVRLNLGPYVDPYGPVTPERLGGPPPRDPVEVQGKAMTAPPSRQRWAVDADFAPMRGAVSHQGSAPLRSRRG